MPDFGVYDSEDAATAQAGLVPKNFFKNVLKSIDVITRSQVHMFERRARTYRTALKDEALNTFDLVRGSCARF